MSQTSGKRSVFLDVDPTIIERNMTIIKENSLEEDLKHLFPSPDVNVAVVKPLPGFCVKTKLKENGEKVFINICYTDEIPPPDDISENELMKILSSEEPTNYKVPMSIGEARPELDKSGQATTAYDVAVSSAFFNKLQTSQVFHAFFLNVVFEGLQNKYGFELESDFVILKNRKSVGNLQTHRIQKRLTGNLNNTDAYKPLIEIINSSNTSAPTVTAKKPENVQKEPNVKAHVNTIDFQLIREPAEGKVEYLVAEFKIDKSLRSHDICLDVGEDRIIVETQRNNQKTDIFVPFIIKQSSVKAVLNLNNSVLIVTMAAEDPKYYNHNS